MAISWLRSVLGLITPLAAIGVVVAAGPASAPSPIDTSGIQFTIGEEPLLEWLRAATPYTMTVGGQLLGADLVLSDPSELRLKDGRASLRVRVKGRTLPIDQVITPVIALVYDKSAGRYFGSLASLPIDWPGVGTIDLKDYVPRFEIPAALENLWRFGDRPIGLNLRLRRIAILDHALEVGAEISFDPIAPAGSRSAAKRR